MISHHYPELEGSDLQQIDHLRLKGALTSPGSSAKSGLRVSDSDEK